MTRTILLATFGVWLLAVAPASAQPRVGGRGYVTFGSTMFAAANTYETLGGSGTQTGLGGGGSITGIWRGLFVDVGLSQQRIEGERVFINAGTVYRLGIPLTITERPVDVAVGWRFPTGRVSPYVGAGMTFISYKETAAFAQTGDDVSEGQSGPLITGGVDVALLRWVHVGGELRYRSVTGVLGSAGVSASRGDNNIGGFSAALRVSVGR